MLDLYAALSRSYVSEQLAGDLLPPRAPSQQAPWFELGSSTGAGQEPRLPSDGDASNVAGGIRLPGTEFASSQLKGFGVTPSRAPLAAWYLPPHGQGCLVGIHLHASAGSFALSAVWRGRTGTVAGCDTFGPESSFKGFF